MSINCRWRPDPGEKDFQKICCLFPPMPFSSRSGASLQELTVKMGEHPSPQFSGPEQSILRSLSYIPLFQAPHVNPSPGFFPSEPFQRSAGNPAIRAPMASGLTVGGPTLQVTLGLIGSRICVSIPHSPCHCRVMGDFGEEKEAERSLRHPNSYLVF